MRSIDGANIWLLYIIEFLSLSFLSCQLWFTIRWSVKISILIMEKMDRPDLWIEIRSVVCL